MSVEVAQRAALITMARAGNGHVAEWMLAKACAAQPLLGQPTNLGMRGVVELRVALDAAFAGVAADWAGGGDTAGTGVDSDLEIGAHWAEVLSRDLPSAARRAAAKPGEAIDVGLLAIALNAAAEAEAGSVNEKMDFLQDIWAMAEEAEMEGE